MHKTALFAFVVFAAMSGPAFGQTAPAPLRLDVRLFGWDFGGVPLSARVDTNVVAVTTAQDIQITGTVTGAFKDAIATLDNLTETVNKRLACGGPRKYSFVITKARPSIVSDGSGIDQARMIVDGYGTHCGTGMWLYFTAVAPISVHSNRTTIELRVGRPSISLTRAAGSFAEWLVPGLSGYINARAADYIREYKLDSVKLVTPGIANEFRPTLKILRLTAMGADLGIVVQVGARITPASIRSRSGFRGSEEAGRARRVPDNAVAARNPS